MTDEENRFHSYHIRNPDNLCGGVRVLKCCFAGKIRCLFIQLHYLYLQKLRSVQTFIDKSYFYDYIPTDRPEHEGAIPNLGTIKVLICAMMRRSAL